jgi:type VI protein secretion system component VasK
LNGKGKTLCSIYRPVLNKFPFNPAATPQATVDDVNALFKKPDGALWKFYDENLQKLLPKQGSQYVAATVGNVTLTPQFVAFFNQAAAFAEAPLRRRHARPAFHLHPQAGAQRRH